jgi:hypothetical protein
LKISLRYAKKLAGILPFASPTISYSSHFLRQGASIRLTKDLFTSKSLALLTKNLTSFFHNGANTLQTHPES